MPGTTRREWRRRCPPLRPTAPADRPSREGRDYRTLRFNSDVGKHGDTGASEAAASDLYIDVDQCVNVIVTLRWDRPDGFARQLIAIQTAPSRVRKLRSVRAPTLVLHGSDDPLVPLAGGEDTAANIPGAHLRVVPGMGHFLRRCRRPPGVS